MQIVRQETCPLPSDRALAEAAAVLNRARAWAYIVDAQWRYVYMTDDVRLSQGSLQGMVPVPLGLHYLSSEAQAVGSGGTVFPVESLREAVAWLGPWMLADTPGGRDALRDVAAPELHDVINAIEPDDASTVRPFQAHGWYTAGAAPLHLEGTAWRVRDAEGRLAGTVMWTLPAVGMAVLGTLAGAGDPEHFARMQHVAKAGRRPAAILFADLEASSPLARRLSTANYFTLGRRLVRAADQAIVDAGGLVGRHVGDGVVAFFVAETLGSESAAAQACVQAARALQGTMPAVAQRSGLAPEDVVLRFGLHWGATLYIGQVNTAGRAEVAALGDEVNEGARIEACATGGRALASKDLLERLDPEDAVTLDLDPDRISYTPLAALPTATEKARRDAPAIAVCEV
jgi:class 3 adenylate cyclase